MLHVHIFYLTNDIQFSILLLTPVFLFPSFTRATASMFLERQIQTVEGIVSGFEEKLAKDGTILDQKNVLPSRKTQLQVLYYNTMKKSQRFNNVRIGLYDPNLFFFFISALSPYTIKQAMLKDVASQKEEVNKLGRDLDLTEQACSPLQQSFNEYCPDIRRQENTVKHLRNRYTNVKNQAQER